MSKRILFLSTVTVAFLLFFACKKPTDDCLVEVPTASFLLNYPDSVEVGIPFDLTINYIVENSCGDFGSFEANKDVNTLEIKLNAKYQGCDCDQQFEEKTVTYPVTFVEASTYTLKLWVKENEYDSYTVIAH